MLPPPAGPKPPSPRLAGLPPVIGPQARLLVLGSMPGLASLRLGQYYAHPRNDFWRLVEQVLGIARALPYEARTAALLEAGVALWDVIGECHRPGSLDADIDMASLRTNDIPALIALNPGIGRIVFNGALADSLYRRRIGEALPGMPTTRLPSTSPANASFSFEQKLAAWQPHLERA